MVKLSGTMSFSSRHPPCQTGRTALWYGLFLLRWVSFQIGISFQVFAVDGFESVS
jgi:hypothetical protein